MTILKNLIRTGIYLMISIIAAITLLFITSNAESPVQVFSEEIHYRYKPTKPIKFKFNSIIRLQIDNKFFCSGIVIDEHYALTASHCVVDFFGKITGNLISIQSDKEEHTGITAKAVAVDRNRDVALLTGNFSNFNISIVDFEGLGVQMLDIPILSCGFPGGGLLFCSHQKLITNKYFRLYGYGGILQKGMSGGPVYSLNTGRVIGVNSSVGDKVNLFGPIVGVDEVFGIR